MVINIGDIDKIDIARAIRFAIGGINKSLAGAFNTCHPDRYNMTWYAWVNHRIGAMKALKQLLDRIEAREMEGENNEQK